MSRIFLLFAQSLVSVWKFQAQNSISEKIHLAYLPEPGPIAKPGVTPGICSENVQLGEYSFLYFLLSKMSDRIRWWLLKPRWTFVCYVVDVVQRGETKMPSCVLSPQQARRLKLDK